MWVIIPRCNDLPDTFGIVPFDANRGVLSSVVFHLDNNGIWANGSVGIEVYNSLFESNGYGISDTSSYLTVLGS